MSTIERLRWTEETMLAINKLTPDIKGKAFDPDWFLLRQRLEQFEAKLEALQAELAKFTDNPQVGTCIYCGAAIWNNEARMTDVGGDFHPICAVNAKVHNLQAANMELVGHVGILLSEIRNAGLNETSHQRAAQFFIKELALKTARP